MSGIHSVEEALSLAVRRRTDPSRLTPAPSCVQPPLSTGLQTRLNNMHLFIPNAADSVNIFPLKVRIHISH